MCYTAMVKAIETEGGRCYQVGGSVRDWLLGQAPRILTPRFTA
jgi:tRNA nucleotidyltransferase/poly(A) polymerase